MEIRGSMLTRFMEPMIAGAAGGEIDLTLERIRARFAPGRTNARPRDRRRWVHRATLRAPAGRFRRRRPAIARSNGSANELRDAGAEVIAGDLLDASALTHALPGCEAAYHLAGDYRVGIRSIRAPGHGGRQRHRRRTAARCGSGDRRRADRPARRSTPSATPATGWSTMRTSGRGHIATFPSTTRRSTGAPRRSTADRRGSAGDDRDARRRVRAGRPFVARWPAAQGGRRAAPSADLRRRGPEHGARRGHRGGIALVGERGRVGESYVLGGELTTLAESCGGCPRSAASAAAHHHPDVDAARRRTARRTHRSRRRELVRASAGVTYWASDAKARRELGYAPRDLETGLVETFGRS